MGTSPFDEDIRCPLVLRACPYLQHLDLAFDSRPCVGPNLTDVFASVPRLRSLRLYPCGDESDWRQVTLRLDRLPQLTSLHCIHLSSFDIRSVPDILNIACHSTLDDVHIESGWRRLNESE